MMISDTILNSFIAEEFFKYPNPEKKKKLKKLKKLKKDMKTKDQLRKEFLKFWNNLVLKRRPEFNEITDFWLDKFDEVINKIK